MAVDPTKTQPAREVGNEPAAWPNEVVPHAEIESKIMILRSAKDRFRDGTDIKLIVTAQATVALHYPPTDARRQKFRADFVAVRIPENSEQIRGFEGKLEPRRLKHSGIFICDCVPAKALDAVKKNTRAVATRQIFISPRYHRGS